MEKTETLPRMFFTRAERFGDETLLLRRVEGRYQGISWRETARAVRECAAGLIALGLSPGDRVGLWAANRPEWLISDLAVMSAGGITVPLYHTSTPVQAARILEKSGTRFLILPGCEGVEALVRAGTAVERFIVLDGDGGDGCGGAALSFAALRGSGREALAAAATAEELDRRIRAGKRGETATIIYTSGTTGDPKGVMLSHGNILWDAEAGASAVPVSPSDTCLSFLPLSHVLERTVGQFLMLMYGAKIAYAGSVLSVADDIPEVRPTLMIGVPRFYEKFHARILAAVRKAPAPRRALFRWAIRVGRRWWRLRSSGLSPGPWLRLQHGLADRLVYAKVRARLGGRIRFFISGGAPLSPEITEFFLSVGVKILEGYGLTESSPVISVNRLEALKPGTVGPPLPGVEVRIAGDGEILVRGPLVMQGYFEDPEATAGVLKGGWLHTGDIGGIDADGFLRITDRKKDVFVTAGGKNVTPQAVENLIAADEFVSQVMLYGDGRKYLTALVVPDYERVAEEASRLGLNGDRPEELARSRRLHDFLMSRIEARTRDLAHFEQVKDIVILEKPLSMEDGELTPTLKVRRRLVTKKYADRLDALYGEDDPPELR